MSELSRKPVFDATTDSQWEKTFETVCRLAGVSSSAYELTPENFNTLLAKVEQNAPQKSKASVPSTDPDKEHVLVVGLLGIINYQLKTMLKRNGYEVSVVKTAEEAVQEFQKNDYKKIVIDLLMPTEFEGFRVLNEIKKIAILCNMQFDIVVMANPTTNQEKLQSEATIHGADYFLVRSNGWHNDLLDYINGNLGQE